MRFAILFLVMSVELVNDCVVFPEQINWKDRVKWSRRWDTQIVGGITGAEDRSSGRSAPLQRLEYTITTYSIQARARLNARLLAAYKSGRACVPFWGRGQELAETINDNLLAGRSYPPIGVFNITVVTGKVYGWVPGPNETELQNGGQTLFSAGTFTAAGSDVTVIGSPNIPVTAQLRRIDPTDVETVGEWAWKEGEYAFFVRPFAPERAVDAGFENRDVLIDAGQSSATPPWDPETSLVAGGSNYSPGSPSIDRTLIKGWAAPPAAVYQTARNISSLSSALSSTWSSFAGAWLVSGLTPGQRYFYSVGAHDTFGCVFFDASNTPTTLADSGSFVTGQNFCYVYCPQTETPGVVRPGQAIVYTIPHLLKGVECQVRLHFAELQSGFDGSTARRQFTIVVQGDDKITAPGFEPYAAAGDALNKAVAVDLTVRANGEGKLTITLIPEAPYFFAGINAVEIYQRAWEVVELIEGTEEHQLVWEQPLKGYWAKDWLVWPAFFGRASIDQARALTGMHADLRLTVQEPLGSGELGVNTCPAEVCPLDPFMELPTPVVLTVNPNRPLNPGEQAFRPTWMSPDNVTRGIGIEPISGTPPGDPAIDGITALQSGLLDIWAAQAWAKWQAYKAEEGLVVTSEGLYWAFEGGGLNPWNANGVFGAGNYAASSYDWEIEIFYVEVP